MSLAETVGSLVREAPFLHTFVGAEVAALVVAGVLLVAAGRRSARVKAAQRAALHGDWEPARATLAASRLLELGSAIPPAFVVATTVWALQRSRALMLQGMAGGDGADQAGRIARGLQGELTSTPLAVLCLVLPTLLSGLAAGLALSARLQGDGLRRGAQLALTDADAASTLARRPGQPSERVVSTVIGFVVLGLAPLACAAFMASLIKFESFIGLVSLDPALKSASFEQAQRTAQAILHRGWLLSSLGSLIAAALAALSWRSRGARVHLPAALMVRSDGVVAAAVIALALAAGFVLLAAPIKRENEMPWPAGEIHARLKGDTPQLEAPDPLALGPVVMLSRTALTVESVPESLSALRDRFLVYRNNFGLLRPGQSFPATVPLACTPDAPADAVLQVLGAAHQAGYQSVTLLFDQRVDVVRPILGSFTLHRTTGARATLLAPDQPPPPGAVVVRSTDAPTCAGISERVARARQQGRDVSVVVESFQPSP